MKIIIIMMVLVPVNRVKWAEQRGDKDTHPRLCDKVSFCTNTAFVEGCIQWNASSAVNHCKCMDSNERSTLVRW